MITTMKARTVAIAKGERKPAPGEPEVWFASIESFAKVLSAGNRDLLRVIAACGHVLTEAAPLRSVCYADASIHERIEVAHTGISDVVDIAGYQYEVVRYGGCSQQGIDDRVCSSCVELTPFEGGRQVHRYNSLMEVAGDRPKPVCESFCLRRISALKHRNSALNLPQDEDTRK